MIELGPTLTTARLVLRPPRQEDFAAWAEVMADEEASRFIGGLQPASVAWRGMASMVGSWALQGFGMFSVLERETGRWIGRVGPHHPHGWPGDEVGWGLVRDAWGRGYAHEAATATMDWAFDVLGWRDVIHCIDRQNAPSIRLAERLGSRRLEPGKMPAPFEDSPIDLYGQSVQDWRGRRRDGGHGRVFGDTSGQQTRP